MAIDAVVKNCHLNPDGSGELELGPRGDSAAGQLSLTFDVAPKGIEQLVDKEIWGGSSFIMLGDIQIAKRLGYVPIEFGGQETFDLALRNYRCSKSQ